MTVHPGFTNDDVVVTDLFTVSAEGRVEHQKLNQTALYTFYSVRWASVFQLNRVEQQKLNRTTPYDAVWLSVWGSTRPSADSGH